MTLERHGALETSVMSSDARAPKMTLERHRALEAFKVGRIDVIRPQLNLGLPRVHEID
jgi:hypothetical protein